MAWDVFCRVVDNYGDIGVSWRLATQLAARGIEVRLWIDDARALAWLAPRGCAGVSVGHWNDAATPADVVLETFGCGLPEAYLQRMAPATPKWIDLEHLSAESYVERSHGLPSPQTAGTAAGLTRWFYFPGFTAATGGLLREPDLLARRQRFRPGAWLSRQGIVRAAGERSVSLFCYDNPALPALLDVLAEQPTLLLAAFGQAAQQVAALLGPGLARGRLRAVLLPPLRQRDYDHLLWCCDLNFVRGEDSFVRAQWAGVPFVWQIYPQSDGVHAAKLDAWLDLHLAGAAPRLAQRVRLAHAAWNGLASPVLELPAPAEWRLHCRRWRGELLGQRDLVDQLLAFAMRDRR